MPGMHIPLVDRQGRKIATAIVDKDDYPWLSLWRWNKQHGGYAVTRIDGKLVYMHRLLVDTPVGWHTDHRNRNPADNRRANLRAVTPAQNLRNTGLGSNNSSGFTGVSWHQQSQKWRARTSINNKDVYIGLYDTPEEANQAYRAFCEPLEAS